MRCQLDTNGLPLLLAIDGAPCISRPRCPLCQMIGVSCRVAPRWHQMAGTGPGHDAGVTISVHPRLASVSIPNPPPNDHLPGHHRTAAASARAPGDGGHERCGQAG